jgi:HAD superfamily hydrolase (TIGR01509 family)
VIEAVIFDLGDTLVRFDDRRPHVRWEEQLGLAPGTLWETVAASVDWREVFLGDDEDPTWEQAAGVLGVPIEDLPTFKEDFFACERIEGELLTFASSLRPGLRTAILSDAPAGTRARTIAKFGLESCFDAVVLSGETRVGKPDPRAFRAALDALSVSAEVTVFVDDQPRNVDAARKLGMQAVLCADSADTIRALQELLA